METGKRGIPTPDVLKKIHEPLGVEYDELMQRAGYISSKKLEKICSQKPLKQWNRLMS
jgi:transcriptional regulator with XRE-family HTH domain